MDEDPGRQLINNRERNFSINAEYDIANESGNYTVHSGDTPVNAGTVSRSQHHQKRWSLNYQEAAIYLQEGENNDKFSSHPRSQDAIPAYVITHNHVFYILDLVAAMLLMFLAVFESPAIFQVHVAIHGSMELLCLLVIAMELGLRMKWLGPKAFVTHIRTMIKAAFLLIMFAEAITVLIRKTSHFRVTRAVRPIFLLDSYYFRGVRRFIRQMIQSLPPIFDMMVFLLFFMLIFSILGFYIFKPVPGDMYFQSFQQSFVSLFVLLTTANFPDVMMPAYSQSRWSAVFFISYLSLELYFLMNLFLAVVYDAFSKNEKGKLRKLLLHKRRACQFSFKLLVTKQNPTRVTLRNFVGLMLYYKPKMSRRDVYLTFKKLNVSKSGTLILDEFHEIYEVSALGWKTKTSDRPWSSGFTYPFNKIFKGLHWLVTWKVFDYFIFAVIFANFVWIIADTIIKSVDSDDDWRATEKQWLWISIMFVCIYVLEAILRILGLGPQQYFTSGWNVFDFVLTLVAVGGIVGQIFDKDYVVVLRPFRLLRLFKMKRRFRDVMGTFFILSSRLLCLAVVLLLLYYFFAIIGMELFAHVPLKNCCQNSSIASFYRYNNDTGEYGYYYLNSFENILLSGVTLFELTVVNNWYVIMEGYAAASTEWSRIYFMIFYLVTMVVMTIVVAFILEAFLFRIQYRARMQGHDTEEIANKNSKFRNRFLNYLFNDTKPLYIDDAILKVDVSLSSDELLMCHSKQLELSSVYIHEERGAADAGRAEGNKVCFRGTRLRSKDDFSLKMYRDEVQEWIAKDEERLRQASEELHEMSQQSVEDHYRPHTNQAV